MKYRADIDGLRAIAVLGVILFHYGVPGFSGGFIGVDVFFVLSGYLIGSIIFSQLNTDSFSFSTFYFRRIRRLFPVYVVVMLLTTMFAYWFMLPSDFREFGQSLLSSTLYLSNIHFYNEAGYFDSASHLKPLLHTWSLSVEEQFYIIFPFLAWLIFYFNKKLILFCILALTFLSFILAEIFIERDMSAVFYLYPFRAWEMFFGVLLSLNRLGQLKNILWANFWSIVGMALIVVPIIFYDQTTMFPALNALAPCLGTILVIYSGLGAGTWVANILSKHAFVYVGKLSYSLYLWHWPVYVLYSYQSVEGIEIIDTIIMAVIMVVLSVLSWKYIETPFRSSKKFYSKKTVVFLTTFIVSGLFIVFGYFVHKTNGLPQRFDANVLKFANVKLFGGFDDCYGNDTEALPNIGYCKVGKPFESDRYVLVWADSHGAAYKNGFAKVVRESGLNALIAWDGGCPPVFDITKDEGFSSAAQDAKCTIRNESIRSLVESDANKISAVVLIGRWSYYTNGSGVGEDAQNSVIVKFQENNAPLKSQEDVFIGAFNKTLKELSDLNLKTYVVEQAPEFAQFRARKVALSMVKQGDSFDTRIKELTSERYENVIYRQGKMPGALEVAETQGLITVLKTHQYFCIEENCSLMIDGQPAYVDNNHVSSSGAIAISSMFQPVIRNIESKQKIKSK